MNGRSSPIEKSGVIYVGVSEEGLCCFCECCFPQYKTVKQNEWYCSHLIDVIVSKSNHCPNSNSRNLIGEFWVEETHWFYYISLNFITWFYYDVLFVYVCRFFYHYSCPIMHVRKITYIIRCCEVLNYSLLESKCQFFTFFF